MEEEWVESSQTNLCNQNHIKKNSTKFNWLWKQRKELEYLETISMVTKSKNHILKHYKFLISTNLYNITILLAF